MVLRKTIWKQKTRSCKKGKREKGRTTSQEGETRNKEIKKKKKLHFFSLSATLLLILHYLVSLIVNQQFAYTLLSLLPSFSVYFFGQAFYSLNFLLSFFLSILTYLFGPLHFDLSTLIYLFISLQHAGLVNYCIVLRWLISCNANLMNSN